MRARFSSSRLSARSKSAVSRSFFNVAPRSADSYCSRIEVQPPAKRASAGSDADFSASATVFQSLAAAMDTLAICLEAGPSAVELLDKLFLDLARANLALRTTMAAIQGQPAALFMVEFVGDSELEVADRVEKLQRRLQGKPGVTALVPALDQTRTVGLVSLPGAFVGALLGGASASQAARFQVVVLIGLLCAEVITATLIGYLLGSPATLPNDAL